MKYFELDKRKIAIALTASFFISLGIVRPVLGKPIPQSVLAAGKLVKRILPKYASQFRFEEIQSATDRFELESDKSTIIVRGNNANSMAVGLNYYLRYYCHADLSWFRADSLFVPEKLPVVDSKVGKRARLRTRFFLNYCTFGYTMPWWTWQDWEWFIDWMALNGINMPLAITGQEAIWQRVYKKLGLSDEDLANFFTGPAYLPWNRMANIDKWEGPLPQSWIDNQLVLQRKIVSRERELGMKPVLPAFNGHVPESIKKKYPNAKITSLGDWAGFHKAYHSFFLDSFDPLFNQIQREYLNEQKRWFGTDHIYGIDPFNEVTPPSWDPQYLANVSENIFKSLQRNDKDARWLQMGWLFYHNRKDWTSPRIQAFLKAVPENKMILLDYFCDKAEVWKRTNKFYGQPYIWCYLGNFGGNTMLIGDLKDVENKIEYTSKSGGSNFAGIGATLEGFDCNPLMYEYLFEKPWSDGPIDVDAWVAAYSRRRFGKADDTVEQAWEILLDNVYRNAVSGSQGTLTNAVPRLKGVGDRAVSEYNYSNAILLRAWRLLINAKGMETKVHQFDVVNIGRQVLGNYFLKLRDHLDQEYEKKDLEGLKRCGHNMLELMDDLDTLLGSNEAFLLGKWIENARQLGVDSAERAYYESDAKMLLTTWGVAGNNVLNDYANRNWAGLTAGYYKIRWKIFIDELIDSLENQRSFNQGDYLKKLVSFESQWPRERNQFSDKPKGNAIELAGKLCEKYSAYISGDDNWP